MRTDTAEKVLEKLATSDKATIVVERQPDEKMGVTSGSYVILRDQVLEIRPSSTPGSRGSRGAQAGRVGPADRAR